MKADWLTEGDVNVVCSEFGSFGRCSGTFRGSSAHAGISEMEHLAIRPCQENENILKMEEN